MSQQVQNVRLKRTQKLLREALIELIEERGFDALTIGELTERAMVSRAAFYRNYQDKYALVEQIFDEAMSDLFAAVGDLGRPIAGRPGYPGYGGGYYRPGWGYGAAAVWAAAAAGAGRAGRGLDRRHPHRRASLAQMSVGSVIIEDLPLLRRVEKGIQDEHADACH